MSIRPYSSARTVEPFSAIATSPANLRRSPAELGRTDRESASSGGKPPLTSAINTEPHANAEGCRLLAKSKVETHLAEAKKRGYQACKVCRPPE